MRTVVLLLTLVAGLAAQARVSGVVKDATGAAIPRATVHLDGVERTTGDDGRFVFGRVAPGEHTVTVEATGFRQVKRQTIVAADTDLGDIALQIGQVDQGDMITASYTNCRDVPGSPRRVTRNLQKMAIQTGEPAISDSVDGGEVVIEIVTEAAGNVACASLHSGDPRLSGSAIVAAYGWRFPPGPAKLGYLAFRVAGRGARVSGVVKDFTGASIPDARVSLGQRTIVTKEDGRFLFENVGSGSDTLFVYASGFDLLERTIVGSSDVDLGVLKLMVSMHGGVDVPLASKNDCWEDAGDPPVITKRLGALAIEAPVPPKQSREGMVRVKILVVPSGAVACAAAVEGDARLADAALQATRRWRFPPDSPFLGHVEFRFSKRGNSIR